MRVGKAAIRKVHTLEIGGSSPSPATKIGSLPLGQKSRAIGSFFIPKLSLSL